MVSIAQRPSRSLAQGFVCAHIVVAQDFFFISKEQLCKFKVIAVVRGGFNRGDSCFKVMDLDTP